MINEAVKHDNLQQKCLVLQTQNTELQTDNHVLQTRVSDLETENSDLKTLLETKSERVSELEFLQKWYEERLRLNARQKYGASSEQTSNYEQLGFFDETEVTADKKAPEPDLEQITYKRKKRVGKREEDLSGLPVETVIHELPKEEQVCPECGEALHVMGKETRRELKVIPAKVVVEEHVRNVYSCRNCEKSGADVPVLKAPMPESVIKNSPASPSAVAHIMSQKYVMHNPLYRQEQEFGRMGIPLSRQTMANWVVAASNNWLSHIYELLRRELLKNEVLHADETTLQVLKEPGRKARTESYMWLYRTSEVDNHRPIALYEYQETRSSSHPKKFLDAWRGYLQTDGYAGYHTLEGVTNVGCWAHMRRKFDEALKGLTPEGQKGSKALIGLEFCNRLFAEERAFEKQFSDEPPPATVLTPSERFKRRYEWRTERSLPVAEEFFAWAKGLKVLPKSPLGVAVKYALDQQKYRVKCQKRLLSERDNQIKSRQYRIGCG